MPTAAAAKDVRELRKIALELRSILEEALKILKDEPGGGDRE